MSAFSGHFRCAVAHHLPHHSQEEISPREGSRNTEKGVEAQAPTLRKVPHLILAWMNLSQNH